MNNEERTKVFIAQPRCEVPNDEVAKVRADIVGEINFDLEPEYCYLVTNNDHPSGYKWTSTNILNAMSEALEKIAESEFVIFAPGWYDDYECRELHTICMKLGVKVVNFEEVFL